MPVSKTNPTQIPPSSVSIGKKPMNYTPTQPSTTQQQQLPKSARAAAKAPAYNTPTQQQQQQQQPNRQTSPPNSNASSMTKGRTAGGGVVGSNGPTTSQKGKASANKIWSTSTTEERERIKEFWLGLGEQERRSLVQIEKDTVLRKMKEQQKHSCSCAVCGRKRNAIEEELEVLYDAYYEELEQYANYQQRYLNSGGASTPPPGPGPFPGSVELDKNGAVVAPIPVPTSKESGRQKPQTKAIQQNGKKQTPQRTRPHLQHHPPGKDTEFDDDVEEDDEYEAEDYEEEEEDEEDELDEDDDDDVEEEEEEVHPRHRMVNGRGTKPGSRPVAGRKNPTTRNSNNRDSVLTIGNSLTVTGPGNILTVADDLLKNDGQKFLEMMEQLAERRLQREEEAAGDVEDESDEDNRDGSDGDDDGDDGAVSEEEDDEDDDDEDEEAMTEEQKMEEGKRMFSIFAARMFEQRVLQAYREKVAQERQLQLLRELDEEDKTSRDREAKKQSQNQKKKDKKRQQKLAKEEERAAREAEKAAEEAKTKAKQAEIEEEIRKKRDEDRQKREAAKRVAEEERVRKEEVKRKRQLEERELQQERERKKKEREERLKKEKDDRERKVKEERARLAKEREEKAERDRIEKERLEKELRLKREKEEKEEREAKEKAQKAAAVLQPRTPIRLNATASSSTSSLSGTSKPIPTVSPPLQRTPNTSGSSVVNGLSPGSNKKAFKSATPLTNSPGIVGQPSRSQSQGSQPQPVISRPPPTPVTPHLPQQSGMMYGHMTPVGQLPVIMPAALSPRVNTFPPMQYSYAHSNMQATPGTPHVNSQPFNAGMPSFDPAVSFNRAPIPPIGVPISRGVTSTSNPPTPIAPLKPKTSGPPMRVTGRRASVAAISSQGPGPITRPMQPIARPSTATAADGTTSSGSGSPSHRSPSPRGILGSSALAADDDEVVPKTPGRRLPTTTPIGTGIPTGPLQSWGPASPRTALNPWISTPSGVNTFPPSPSRGGPNGSGHGVSAAPVPQPTSSVELLWANTTAPTAPPNDAPWHPQNAGPFFHHQYVNHHLNAAANASAASHGGS